HIKTLRVKEAVDLILHNLRTPSFRVTPRSRKTLDDLTLAAQVEAALVDDFPRVKAFADGGKVFVTVWAPAATAKRSEEEVRAVASRTPGVDEVAVNVTPLSIMTP
ncbi:MAG: hypothetical protein ACYTAF_15180, partial [Planctomycetota bacterium]